MTHAQSCKVTDIISTSRPISDNDQSLRRIVSDNEEIRHWKKVCDDNQHTKKKSESEIQE